MPIKYSRMVQQSMGMSSGTSADRPENPTVGEQFVNGTLGITEVYTENDGWQPLTSSSTGIPYGTTADRPANPELGQPFFNGTSTRLEIYSTTGWQNIVQETPSVVSVSGTYIEQNQSSTITINGTNFDDNATVVAIGQDSQQVLPDTITVVSLVEISATFSGLAKDNEPYDIKVTNPSNLFGVGVDALQVDDIPVWLVQSGTLGTYTEEVPMSLTASEYISDEENSPLIFSVISGELPNGLSINSSTGTISGTPTDIIPNTTSFFTLSATDGNNTTTRNFSITINDRGPVWNTSPTLSAFSKNIFYSDIVNASDDDSLIAYSVTAGTLPDGLSLNASTGEISGTPTSDTTAIFTIRATDLGSNNYSDRQFTISNPGPVWQSTNEIEIYSDSNSIQLSAVDDSGIDPTYSVLGALPTGMSLSTSGVLSGSAPGSEGSLYSFTVRATDNNGVFSDRLFSATTRLRLYPFTSHTFTTAGSTGREGPTLANVRSTYSTSWSDNYLDMIEQGIQRWTVPLTGEYTITAAGAGGGNGDDTANDSRPGYGAEISGTFNLTGGQVIKLLVGQRGGNGNTNSSAGGGGGGGSYVVSINNDPILIAAGGNGESWDNWAVPGPGGLVTNNGTSLGGDGERSGGGGGLTGNGQSGSQGGGGGLSFLGGGIGGTNASQGGVGGFGGGGGSLYEGGGGGGYNGGRGVPSNQYTTEYPDYGAGSFNSGSNQSGTADINTGDGYITITKL